MNLKQGIKAIPLINILLSVLLLIVSFLLAKLPENKTYYYEHGSIVTHSWHDIFNGLTALFIKVILIVSAVLIIVYIRKKLKYKEKIAFEIVSVLASSVICLIITVFSNILVIGIWSDNDYYPVCYEFTDGVHTIVIEERSFLLSGGGTIYEIQDNNEAYILGSFTTDDGGRNNGHYDINWYNSCAEISYDTFNNAKDSMDTITVTFKSSDFNKQTKDF